MKKILVLFLIIFLIPYLVVALFIHNSEENSDFQFESNMVVKVKREKSGQIDEVPFEEYVLGVLAGEMPVSFQKEALKAQAVAARSYVMKHMQRNKGKEYDVVDTVMNQVYLDREYLKTAWKDKYDERIQKLKEVIDETNGEYLAYDGQVIEAFFFSTSTGMTENSGEIFITQLPYLTSVKSEWDKDISPVFSENVTLSLSDFYTKLNLPYQENLKIEIKSTTSTGRVKELSINGKDFTGGTLCTKLGLRSTYITITQQGSNVLVNSKGYGHGVGMSQYGAEGMAREGYGYEEILKHYYQGVEIKKI